MLIKAGVDISRLNRNIRKSLSRVENIIVLYGGELVITSAYEGNHMAGSLHYSNDAYDIRCNSDKVKALKTVDDIKNALGSDYDVVYEGNHIHIEYDPK